MASWVRIGNLVENQIESISKEFIQGIYRKFMKQYEWFKSTQSAHISDYYYAGDFTVGFKWRGRKGSHILTSGLDDYPRSANAHIGDLHVDLLAWMAYFSEILGEASEYLGLTEESKKLQRENKEMIKTLMGTYFLPRIAL